MDDKILNIFRSSNGEFISGEEISEKLKVSRAAVWKHIDKLRKEGYEITGEPHVGYRLISAPEVNPRGDIAQARHEDNRKEDIFIRDDRFHK